MLSTLSLCSYQTGLRWTRTSRAPPRRLPHGSWTCSPLLSETSCKQCVSSEGEPHLALTPYPPT
ncbi:hypothetical protein JYU34_009871 [Plutella xylostella]|uniref:Uncharacterized protein n=1 Tax=Plutella xylostella TaxID=51655 RepID=A0ABQ7Q7A6_PLUXY|nr:hypothetical protein JYU34_015539 [Plutella xylostella]KAG7305746.1 hypothetical protein JYU34_009871 [Plutella xylostella]